MNEFLKFVADIDWENVIVAAIFLVIGAVVTELVHYRRARVRWEVEYVTVSGEGRNGPILYVRNLGSFTAYDVRATAAWTIGSPPIRTSLR